MAFRGSAVTLTTIFSVMLRTMTENFLPAAAGQERPEVGRLLRAVAERVRSARAHPLLSPRALAERWRERRGGHPAEEAHGPHLEAALEWLARAQDVTPEGGIARGYSLTWNPYFGSRGWQPPYPETTGYLIPTLYAAAHHLGRPDLAQRAERAAAWEIEVQLPSGAVRGGVIGEPESPAVFNTGQVMFGWLSAFAETRDDRYADATRRAGRFLVSTVDRDGHWRFGNSRFARAGSTTYNVRTAWALALEGLRLSEPTFVDVAKRNLEFVLGRIHPDGWLPDCCLNDPERPLLHTLAYAIRGLVEGGAVLQNERATEIGAIAAEHLARAVREDGWMAGRFAAEWRPAVTWSCLTGEAQMANVWLRLFQLTGEAKWLEPVPRVLRFLKSTQNRTSRDPGLRGGIKGSAPIGGEYGRYEVLSGATKFFIDALIRHEQILSGAMVPAAPTHHFG